MSKGSKATRRSANAKAKKSTLAAHVPETTIETECKFQQGRSELRWLGIAYLVAGFLLVVACAWSSLVSSLGISRMLLTVSLCAVFAVCAYSVWEALRPERLFAHSTPMQMLRTLLQMFGDVLLIPLYAVLPQEKPILGYQGTAQNDDILAQCPSLQSFHQTPWLRNAHLSFAALMCRDFAGAERNKENVRRESLRTADGGIVALDWWEPKEGSADAAKADKILFIGSTYTGDSLVTGNRLVCEYFTARGWRCVTLVKRGCGLFMPNMQQQEGESVASGNGPAPWCLSGFEDTKFGIDHVARMYPDLPICALGISTGAGQLREYLTKVSEESKLAAAVIIDAAPSWCRALTSIDERIPLVAKALTGAAELTYSQCGLPPVPPTPEIAAGTVAGGMVEFASNRMAPAHGFERSLAGGAEYARSCSPASASRVAVPMLNLLALQDMLITPEEIWEVHNHFKLSPNVVSATTRNGTHMVRWTGLRPECWLSQASEEFLSGALKVRGVPSSTM